jgi:hypothetical protein
LSESECYARLYGDRESTVAVIWERDPERPSSLLGEQLQRLFEERLGVEDELPEAAEAA